LRCEVEEAARSPPTMQGTTRLLPYTLRRRRPDRRSRWGKGISLVNFFPLYYPPPPGPDEVRTCTPQGSGRRPAPRSGPPRVGAASLRAAGPGGHPRSERSEVVLRERSERINFAYKTQQGIFIFTKFKTEERLCKCQCIIGKKPRASPAQREGLRDRDERRERHMSRASGRYQPPTRPRATALLAVQRLRELLLHTEAVLS